MVKDCCINHVVEIKQNGARYNGDFKREAEILEMQINNCFSFSVFSGSIPVACAGVYPLWRGVGEAWMVVTDKLYKYALTVFRDVKSQIKAAWRIMELHRLQSVCRKDGDDMNFLEHLGFINEGLLRNYFPDRQCGVMMSITELV